MQGAFRPQINGAGLLEWSIRGVRFSYIASRSPSSIDQSDREVGAAIVVERGVKRALTV